ncbi:MAG: WYL domain-containing protein [Bacteroides sp.]|nr:WYL domain-containing protein [Bacteroides sp.]
MSKKGWQAIDLSRLDAFVGNTPRKELAKLLDDKLAGNNEYLTLAQLLDLDSEAPLKVDDRIEDVYKILSDMGKYLEAVGHPMEVRKIKSNSKNKEYRYPLDYQYPFKEHRKVTKKLPISETNDIAVQIANFIPAKFREDLLTGTAILAAYQLHKDNGCAYVGAEDSSLLKGVKHMKEILVAIRTKQKMWVQYEPKYQYDIEFELHPQYLKEYNGRWYVIGRTISLDKNSGKEELRDRQNLALDRIIDLDLTGDSDYLANTNIDYEEYFSDIVGVTHDKEWPDILHIELKLHTPYVYNLLRTKKLHPSQIEREGDGDFYVELDVRPNRELTAKILSFGSAVEVVSPIKYREHIASEIAKMMQHY